MNDTTIVKAGQAASDAQKLYPKIGLLIDGEWIYDRPALQDIVNPSNETVLGQLPRATPDDLHRALAAAQRGFDIWRKIHTR